MRSHKFRVSPLNFHYEGEYSDRMIEWRRLGAIDKVDHIAALVGKHRDSLGSVLEIGCGTGAVLARMRVLGIGRTHQGVDMADPGPHVDQGAAELDLRVYDGKTLPFPDDAFDLVVASHVLEHVPDERGFLVEAARVSRRFIYVEVPCELNLLTSHAKLQRTLDIGHINAYTPESFALKLATADLDVVHTQLFDHAYAVHAFMASPLKAGFKMALRRMLLGASPRLANRVFTYHCGALCRLSAA